MKITLIQASILEYNAEIAHEEAAENYTDEVSYSAALAAPDAMIAKAVAIEANNSTRVAAAKAKLATFTRDEQESGIENAYYTFAGQMEASKVAMDLIPKSFEFWECAVSGAYSVSVDG